MRALGLLLASLIAAARQTSPVQPTATVALSGNLAGIDASAKMQAVGAGQLRANLEVSVTMWNHSGSAVQFVVGTWCPVFVRLYSADSTVAQPSYYEGQHPCVRSGKSVELAPGQSVFLADMNQLCDVERGPRTSLRIQVPSARQLGGRSLRLDSRRLYRADPAVARVAVLASN
jgi:hypothetical protein